MADVQIDWTVDAFYDQRSEKVSREDALKILLERYAGFDDPLQLAAHLRNIDEPIEQVLSRAVALLPSDLLRKDALATLDMLPVFRAMETALADSATGTVNGVRVAETDDIEGLRTGLRAIVHEQGQDALKLHQDAIKEMFPSISLESEKALLSKAAEAHSTSTTLKGEYTLADAKLVITQASEGMTIETTVGDTTTTDGTTTTPTTSSGVPDFSVGDLPTEDGVTKGRKPQSERDLRNLFITQGALWDEIRTNVGVGGYMPVVDLGERIYGGPKSMADTLGINFSDSTLNVFGAAQYIHTKSDPEVKALQERLVKAGRLAEDGYIPGVVDTTPGGTLEAWKKLVLDAWQAQEAVTPMLVREISANEERQRIAIDNALAALEEPDTETFAYNANGLAQTILGRTLSPQEMVRLRKHMIDFQRERASEAIGLGTSPTLLNDAEIDANTGAYLRKFNRMEAEAFERQSGTLNLFDQLGVDLKMPDLSEDEILMYAAQAQENGWTPQRMAIQVLLNAGRFDQKAGE